MGIRDVKDSYDYKEINIDNYDDSYEEYENEEDKKTINAGEKFEFSNLEIANTNEYAIEFWYFIYEYDKNNILFNFQEIKWTNHIKIQIYNENGNLIVDMIKLDNELSLIN